VGARTAPAPTLDEGAAEALAVLTLLVVGGPRDGEFAAKLVDERTADPEGQWRMLHGTLSLSAALLALLDFYGGVSPEEGLRELGRIIAQAGCG
jgi:hypothetical protein